MTDSTVNNQGSRPLIKLLVGVFFISMLVSGIVIYLILDQVIDNDTAPDYTEFVLESEGGVRTIDPPRAVADFTLTAHTGEAVSISDLRGQNVMLYFGYLNCPDVCPLTLMDMQEVDSIIGEQIDNMAYVYVSVDGERDTPEVMANYLQRRQIDDMVIGLTGEEVILERITPDYGLFYQLNQPQENGFYSVDHTASLFFLNTEGELARIFAYGTDPTVIAEEIIALQ